MWSTIGIIVVACAIFCLEFPKLKKARINKDIWCFSLILLCATVVSILEARGVELPNPLDYIQSFYKSIHSMFRL